MRLWFCLTVLLAAAAWLAGVARVTLPGFIDGRLNAAVRDNIVWRADSSQDVHRRFVRDNHPGDPPVFLRAYVLNITNLAEVQAGGKPVLAEVGPYTYLKHRVKRHVWFSRDGQVQFKEYDYHLFQPHLSNASLDAPITTLNIPLVGALEAVGALAPSAAHRWLELLASLIASWQDEHVRGLFTTRTAEELLWGYRDPLLASLAPLLPGINPTFQLLQNMSGPAEADCYPATLVNTGLRNLTQVWQYELWNNVTEVTSWNNHVEPVRGTDGFQFRPGLAMGDGLEVWAGQLFRAARIVATEQARLGWVPLLRFRPDPTQGDPDERYFQYIRGLMNITSPMAAGPSGKAGKPGPPLFLSYPHYCGADESLARGVVGMQCNPQRHELYVDLEPTTGITVRAAHRLMLTSWFGSKWRSIEPDVRSTYLPVFWVEEFAQASPAQLQLFGPMLGAQAAVLAITRCALPVALAAGLLAAACGTLAWRQRGQRVAAGAQRGKGPEEAGFQQGEGAPWEAAGQDEGAATPPLAGASPRARRGRGRAVGGGDGNGVDSWPLLAESPDES